MKKSTDKNSDIIGSEDKLPTFPDDLYSQLPKFLKDSVKYTTSNQEKDMILLGTLTSISSCLPKVYGIYEREKIYSNLFLYVAAPPSSGKGKLSLCKKIIEPIHNYLKEQTDLLKNEYKKDSAEHQINELLKTTLSKPKPPLNKMLFIPANNSSTGMYELLSNNDGRGIIFETEGDTITQALKTDYGNYSDGFRKAFQHETISYYRRTEKEHIEINNPCLSVVLSGTPGQVFSLIPNAENGLFSRFIFYFLNLESHWIDVFEHSSSNNLSENYKDLGERFFMLYNQLNDNDEIKVSLSESQGEKFNHFFSKTQDKFININSDEYIASIRRLGIITFRFMMIFTVLRSLEDGDITQDKVCSDIDFENALKMSRILIEHSRKMFLKLPKASIPSGFKNSKEIFIDALPKTFNRKGYLSIAKELDINEKTAERYIKKLVDEGILNRKSHNNYINTLIQDEEKVKDIKNTDTSSSESSTSSESAES